jgi:hypothetical protein
MTAFTVTYPVYGRIPSAADRATASTEKALFMLSTLRPMVTVTSLDPETLGAMLHARELTEVHAVASHPVTPMRALSVNMVTPRPAPSICKGADALSP